MRDAFCDRLVELAAREARVWLLTGDLGFSVLEPFAARFPERFVNVGCAEQNMVGIATGLAEAGLVPFVYSIATFATLRPLEMIRNGPVLHGLPVRIVGVGGGFEYGPAGASHHALEDLAALRALPGLRIVVPADGAQARAALDATWDAPAPVYYRLGKTSEGALPGLGGAFGGGVHTIADGADVCLLAAGPVAFEAVGARRRLRERGLRARVVVVSELAPPPREALAAAVASIPLAVTVEEHVAVGGLGSLVAETLAGIGSGCRLVRAGVRGRPDGRTGDRAWHRGRHGLTADALAQLVLEELGRVRPARPVG